jgi:hypothetical protein
MPVPLRRAAALSRQNWTSKDRGMIACKRLVLHRRLRIRSWSWLAAAAVLVACSDHKNNGEVLASQRVQELDVPGFHELLTHQDTAAQVERVGIEPRGHDGAEYVVVLRNTPVRRVVHAEFPGTFLDELYDARIPYSVKPKIPPSVEKEVQMDATTFRVRLADPIEVAQIASIRAEPLGQGAARYVVIIACVGWSPSDRVGELLNKELLGIMMLAPPRVLCLEPPLGLIEQDDLHDERDTA